ncbi:Aldose 1-epimerase [Hypsibius exemplaris]|uniref:Aldose 1-epimerase n=1 Tax=Hypsibius exemplaris TaxID=2072580 RepID=A0A9X6RK39_HYPEX|nr:Aldose 1-epimerase [Hypsibius exemplaris]
MAFSQPIQLYEIENQHGAVLSIINYGARIIGLKVPSLQGGLVDVVCGLKSLEDYEKDDLYFGAIVGRCAGRIAPPLVTIDGKSHHLTANSGDVHLHGGLNGFDKAIWKVDPIEGEKGVEGVRLRHVSPAGTEGYPGELVTEVEYRLTNDNEVIVRIKATCQEATIVNLPQHSYFNLGGSEERDIYDHVVTISSETYLPMGANSVPTGEILPVKNTVFDFQTPQNLGAAIRLTSDDGFDNYWCLTTTPHHTPKNAVNVYHPKTGINMEVLTTQPGVLMYTGNYLHKAVIGKYNNVLDRHSALCFETQGYPNAINVPTFPSVIVRPGLPYDHTTIWRFSKVKHKNHTVNEDV